MRLYMQLKIISHRKLFHSQNRIEYEFMYSIRLEYKKRKNGL